jgi:hypothetical protein
MISLASVGERKDKTTGAAFIKSYVFPTGVGEKLGQKYPHLSDDQLLQTLEALKDYFLICLHAGAISKGAAIAMPSIVVDHAWHEFILNSHAYTEFCDTAFGGYLHHRPGNEKQVTPFQSAARLAGKQQLTMLAGLPLLFAIDNALAIDGGGSSCAGGGGCGGGSC